MALSRFENFKAVDFNDMPIVAPDVETLGKVMGQIQTEYDTGIAKFEEADFKNLSADAESARALRQAQHQLIDDVTDNYTQSISAGRRAMSGGLRALQRDYRPGGRRHAINSNYESFVTERKRQKKRIGKKGGITMEQFENWQTYNLNSFAQAGGTVQDEYGDWSTISMDDIAAYVNGNEAADKTAKDWKANNIKTGRWWKDKKSGEIMKKTIHGDKRVTEEEIMRGTVNALMKDSELVQYLEQYAEHTGQNLALDDVGQLLEDGSFAWNYDNPLVGFAVTPAIKYSYKDEINDQDINLSLEKQRRSQGFAKQQARDRMATTNKVVYGATTKKVSDNFNSMQDVNDTLTEYTTQMDTLKKSISKGNMSPAQLKAAREKLNYLNLSKHNLEIARDELFETHFPELVENKHRLENALSELGIPDNVNKMALAQATAKAGTGNPQDIMNVYKEIIKSSLGIDITQGTSEFTTGESVLTNLYTLNSLAKENDARVDKVIQANLANSLADRAVPQAEITIDQTMGDEYRDKDGNVIQRGSLTQGTVENQLVTNPEIFLYEHPDLGVVDGNKFRAQMEEKFPDLEFDWSTQTLSTYIPSNEYHLDGKNLKSLNKSMVSVSYKNKSETDRTTSSTMQFKIGYTEASEHLAMGIEEDIKTFTKDEAAIELLDRVNATKNGPDEAFSRLEQGQQTKLVLGMPAQQGDRDVGASPKISIAKRSAEGVSDTYIVKYGGYKKEFYDDVKGAQKHYSDLKAVALYAQGYRSIKEATHDIWRDMSSMPNPLFESPKELGKFLHHLKNRN